MVAFIGSIVPLLPALIAILGWILKAMGANADTIKAYEDLVKATKDSGLISVNARDRMKEQEQQIIDEEKK